jgi:hypothetical protein
MNEIIIFEEGYIFKENVILFRVYPDCKISLPEGWGIYNGPKEELVEQGFTFDENYFE